MMKTVIGSALGGLVAGAVALVAVAAPRGGPESAAYAPGYNDPRAMTVAESYDANALGAQPTLVRCGPGQDALSRRLVVSGREVTEVTCVDGLPPQAAAASDIVYAPAPQTRTVTRTAAARPAVVRERVVTREAADRKKRSWGKTAMIVGGGAGAGAGVGGLVGGKKGALIGAAIGGGSAAIYEATKR